MGKNAKGKKTKPANSKLTNLVTALFQKCVNPTESSTPSPKELFNAHKEICGMLDEIEKLEGPSAISEMKKREDCVSDFIRWAKNQNIFFDHVELKTVRDSELGVFAKQQLEEAEMYIKVPRSAMITSETVTGSPIAALVADDPILSTMPNVALALFLVHELCNKKSKWQPYIDILPRSYNNILYFDLADLEILRGTSVFLDALNILRSIARQYAYIRNLMAMHPLGIKLGLANKITYADYKWAVATLMTRQNPIPSPNNAAPTLALIPFLDLCNHSEGVASIDYNDEKQMCECLAPTSVSKGDEVLIYYGARPNTELVIYNGFFYPDNTYDFIKLKLGLSKTDPEYERRKELMQRLEIGDVLQLGCQPPPLKSSLTAFLTILSASPQELEAMEKAESTELENGIVNSTFIRTETKKKMLTFLRDRCNLLLRLLPAMPHPHGEAIGDTGKLSSALRANERKLLADTVLYTEKELENFQD